MRKASCSASAGGLRVQPRERVTRTLLEHHLAVVAPLGFRHVRRNVRAVDDPPSGTLERGERSFLDDGLLRRGRSRGFVTGCSNAR